MSPSAGSEQRVEETPEREHLWARWVLGVAPRASVADIKKRFWALRIQFAPETHPTEAERYTEISKTINTAYGVLVPK
ncbi:MAG: J domain-containing protein [Deltaproteobacteria bacterium]|nr:J domain-containing protein [Deltaproteobacteria bacterium]